MPKNVDFNIIDYFEKVSDKDGAIMARRISREKESWLVILLVAQLQAINQLKINYQKKM